MTTNSTKPIKTFLEVIKTYWGYFMTIVAAVTFVWTVGVKSERKNNEKISTKEDLKELKILRAEDTKKLDSILFVVMNLQRGQNELVKNQNAMRNSYVTFLTNYKPLTLDQFIKLMNGLEFQLNSIDTTKTVLPEFKIGIKQIKN